MSLMADIPSANNLNSRTIYNAQKDNNMELQTFILRNYLNEQGNEVNRPSFTPGDL